MSRYRDQKIMIGNDIVVTVVDIRGDKVRLGIEADAKVPVHRLEVYDAIKRENAANESIVGSDESRQAGSGGMVPGASDPEK